MDDNQEKLKVILDSVDAIIYVADMSTHEILFANKFVKDSFGDVEGMICWKALQENQTGPCSFCTNDKLLDGEGKPAGLYCWEFCNTVTGKWYTIHDRAIKWDGDRFVRLEIATEITSLKKVEKELETSKKRLEEAQRIARLGHWISDPGTGYLWWSDVIYEIFGYNPDIYFPSIEKFYNVIHPADRAAVKDSIRDSEESGVLDIEHRIIRPDGTVRWVHELATIQRDEQGRLLRVGTAQDISRQKEAELASQRANRSLRALIKANSALIYANNEASLFNQVCRALAENRGYPLVWVGIAEDDEEQSVIPVGRAGDCTDYLKNIRVTWGNEATGQGPIGMAIRTGSIQVATNILTDGNFHPWGDIARKYGLASSVAVPLKYEGGTIGSLNVYGDRPEAFDDEEKKLLSELARNISYGIETLRTRKENDLNTAELRLYATVFKHSAEGILITDTETNIVAVNQAFTRITGYSRDEVLGRKPNLLSSGLQGKEFYRTLWKTLAEQGLWQGEIRNSRKNGEIYSEWITISEVRDESGTLTNYIAVFVDVTKVRQTEQELVFLTYHDSLTHLPNRTLYRERLKHALLGLERRKRNIAVVILDLEGFGALNDSLGPDAGDDVLKKVAHRLRAALREGDTVARSGGDEFWILLEDLAHSEDTDRVVQNIMTFLHKPLTVEGQTFRLEASVGIALGPLDSGEMNELLTMAATALHRAQKMGVGRIQYFRPEMGEQAGKRLQLEEALKVAIEKEELRVWYQPQVELATGEILAVEALVRWQHPEWGLISPADFIPIAEETGLVVPLGEWVLEQAVIQCARWRAMGLAIERVSVNIAAAQLQGVGLKERVSAVLGKTGLPATCLELEITEDSFLVDLEKARSTINDLADLGLRLAIDDFGTGYSSLSYLKSLPVDTLKIDKTFINGLPDDEHDRSIVKAILAMAEALGLDVLPEGVENVTQAGWLEKQKVRMGQGFLYSAPRPALEVEKMLKDLDN